MKRRRVAIAAVLTLVVLAAGTGIALYWASRSETVLRWAIAQAAQRLPGQLTVEGVSGSLSQPIAIAHVRYTQDTLTVEGRDVTLNWSPWELLAAKRVHIQELHMRQLDALMLDGKGGSKPSLPDRLAVPLPIQVDRLLVDQLEVRNQTAAVFSASTVKLSYAGDARGHRLVVENVTTEWGRVKTELHLAAQRPFALTGRADFQGAPAPGWPVLAHLDLSGILSAMDAAWQLRVRDTLITGALRVTPFATMVLESVIAKADGVDVKQFLAQAPQTALDVVYEAKGAPGPQLEGRLSVVNHLPGTIDQRRVPLTALQGQLTVTPGALKLARAAADLGSAGKATLDADLARGAATVTLATQNLDLRGIHTALRATHLAGIVDASIGAHGREYRGTLSQNAMRLAFLARQKGDVLLIESMHAQAGSASISASGKLGLTEPNPFTARGELSRFDPAAFGDFPAAAINGGFDAAGTLRPDWHVQLAYRLARSTFRGQALSGSGKLTASARAVKDVDAELALATNRLRLQGAFGRDGDVMRVKLDAPALQALGPKWSGSAHAAGSVSGTFARPGFDLDLNAHGLALPGGYRADILQVRGKLQPAEPAQFDLTGHAQGLSAAGQSVESADLRGVGTTRQHQLEMRLVSSGVDAKSSAEGSWNATARSWSGRLLTFENRGDYPFKMSAPTGLTIAPEQVAVGGTRIELVGGRIELGETRYARGELSSSGSLTGLSLARLLACAKVSAPVHTTMLVGGRWNITARQRVDGQLELHRESGDASVTVDEQQLALEITQLAAQVDIRADAVAAQLTVDAKRLGQVTARAQTRLTRRDNQWGLSGRAPLSLSAHADVVTLKPIVALYNKSIAADGRLTLEVSGEGTVSEPDLRGHIDAQQIVLEQVENGVFLRDGVLHANFDDRALDVSEFSIAAGDGRLTGKGRAFAKDGQLDAHIDWNADHLAAVQRPDLFLAISGSGALQYRRERVALKGQMRVDRGHVELRSGSAPSLGDDVVVVGHKNDGQTKVKVLSSAVDLMLDLGPDFTVVGNGLDAKVEGKLHLTSPGDAPLSAEGEVKLVRGTYEAYGRKLDVESGTLYFTGPLDNPGLSIRALRKNQQVEAGVEISGTARAPRVRLVSNPDVPDPDKLAWLVLGRKVDASSHSDTQALQSSAALLLADVGTSPLQKQLAKTFGLDEISFATPDASGTGGVVTLAKRISDRIYVIFERGLGTAGSAIKVNYQLSRRWSLRTESGRTDAVDLFYSFSWD